ncbi:MAG: ATP-binding protein [Odoribacteraceae bacterium]|jgi:molecular chaperone HtpG|nr:ATP-binding protein [Odoribacteraceae bacterium]
MNEYKSVVGKKLIEILMFSMYPDAKIIYREYIQNSRDAIKDAVEVGTLRQLNDGHIIVDIDNDQRRIIITDNGTGVSVKEVEPILLNIADSTKDGETSAGQFGIGRLVGGGYCKKLSFKTSFKGEKYASEITFDVEKARTILDDDKDRRSAAEVIDAIAERGLHEEEERKHYFIVTLDEVRPEYPELLDSRIISEYLKEVAPIDYQFVFKNKLIQTSVPPEFVELQKQIGYCQLTINEETDIRKKYGLNIAGTGDKINGLEYFKIQDDDFGLLAWGWYALTEFSQAIPDSDNSRGFRLRKHNILIGDKNYLNQFHKEPRGNKYFYGEVHAIHPKLKPNSARDGLAPTPEAMRLQKFLRDYFYTLYQLYHLANQMKTAARDIVAVQAKIQQATEHEDIPEVKQKWETAQKKLESATNSTKAQSEAGQKVVEIYKKKLKDIIKNSPIPIPAVTTTNGTVVAEPPPVSTDPKHLLDKFYTLRLKYTEQEVAIVRRSFKYLRDNCPSQHTKLIDELTSKVIKDLSR